jgi:hypothetical protein
MLLAQSPHHFAIDKVLKVNSMGRRLAPSISVPDLTRKEYHFGASNPSLGTVSAVLFHHSDKDFLARQLIPRQYRISLTLTTLVETRRDAGLAARFCTTCPVPCSLHPASREWTDLRARQTPQPKLLQPNTRMVLIAIVLLQP